MAPSHTTPNDFTIHDDQDDMLDEAEAEEELQPDGDHPMESDEEEADVGEEIQLENDSIAHFDKNKGSLFCIAAHPLDPSLVAVGGADDTGYVFYASTPSPLLPSSYESNPEPGRKSLAATAILKGHTDSVNAITFTLPRGDFLCTGGLDGHVRVYSAPIPSPLIAPQFNFLGEVHEVDEINWLASSPHPNYANTIALGAADGSVWVYTASSTPGEALQVLQAYYLHTAPCTAGSWSPDGKLLATVAEDGSFNVWDPFGEAAAAGITPPSGSQTIISLTAADQRFAVEGGLFSVAIAPTGAFAAVGGAEGAIRIVGLPRFSASTSLNSNTNATKPKAGGAKNRSGGGKQSEGSEASTGQAGQILASLQKQSDSVESLAFSSPPLTLLAAGSTDGSIALFDTAHRFAVRRRIIDAHEGEPVVQVAFLPPRSPSNPQISVSNPHPGIKGAENGGWILTTCGLDGVVRRWDTRGGTAAGGQGLIGEWKGHRGGGGGEDPEEGGGGVLGFVHTPERVVTAGDDGVSLVFDTTYPGS